MLYAAYGSNLHPVRLRKRVPSAELIGFAVVANWELRFHKRGSDGSGKCNIVPATDDSVCFAIFRIEPRERSLLDKVEGLGKGYDETTIVIPGYGECFAYTARDSHIDDRLTPYTWYKELVLAGLSYHFSQHDIEHESHRKYIERVLAVGAYRDENAARHEENMALVERARVSG